MRLLQPRQSRPMGVLCDRHRPFSGRKHLIGPEETPAPPVCGEGEEPESVTSSQHMMRTEAIGDWLVLTSG